MAIKHRMYETRMTFSPSQVIDKIYDKTPGFDDLFDEETFYVFAACFTLLTCLAAFVASR